MNTTNVKMVSVSDWDALVKQTYGRPYSFQQQDGCKDRGKFRLKVPDGAEDYPNDTVPEEVNHAKMGVSFSAWLKRDPKTPLRPTDQTFKPTGETWETSMWWERNFYPDIQMVANDLHAKGLLEAGNYVIDIDW
jgi:hypothetical protein